MNSTKKLDLFFLEEFINKQILNYRDSKDIILQLGTVDKVNIDNIYFLTPYNQNLNKIILCFEKEKLNFITILAEFDFNFLDLIKKYGIYREFYSHYDDTYFYFFNENNEIDYYVECDSTKSYKGFNFNKEIMIKKIKIIFKKVT